MTDSGAPLVFRNAPLATAAAIMREAAAWLNERDQTLWSAEDLTDEVLAQRCQPSEIFVGYLSESPVVAALIQTRDPLWPDDNAALIVHKLSVCRAHAGRGGAAQMLDFAASLARTKGKKFVRLDCADRPKLRAFYERAGFRPMGVKRLGQLDVVLHERAL